MRRKFFLIVLAFLVSSILVVSILQLFFFESERLNLVDQRLETITSSLIASGLSLHMIQNLESTDDLISDLLGEERADHMINVYSLDGEILAQNFTAAEMKLGFEPELAHETRQVKGLTVRVLNIKKGHLVIQVAAAIGPSLLNRWAVSNSRFVFFTLFVLVLLVIAAYFSSGALFTPLRRLTLELGAMSAQLEGKLGQNLTGFVVGPELAGLSRGRKDTKDEFELLCAEIESFLEKLGAYTRSFNAQTAILTHELKTPLTVLRNELQELDRATTLADARRAGERARADVDDLTGLINNFLQWSVLTSNPGKPDEIYALKVTEIASRVVGDLNPLHGGRIELDAAGAVTAFALPDHVRQLLVNLLSNALHYLPADQTVQCRITDDALEIEDRGPGIDPAVRENLGRPFNRGEVQAAGHKSSGLGLAWVYTLCEKYGWRLEIPVRTHGTLIRVRFT